MWIAGPRRGWPGQGAGSGWGRLPQVCPAGGQHRRNGPQKRLERESLNERCLQINLGSREFGKGVPRLLLCQQG